MISIGGKFLSVIQPLEETMPTAGPELTALWQTRISDWQSTDQTMKRWCQEHDVSYIQFTYWKSRLCGKREKSADTSSFVELPDDTSEACGVVIEFRGLRLHLDRHFDEESLIRCLRLLGKMSC